MLQPCSATLIWLLLDLRRKASDAMQGTATAEESQKSPAGGIYLAINYLYASNEGDTKSLCAAMQW